MSVSFSDIRWDTAAEGGVTRRGTLALSAAALLAGIMVLVEARADMERDGGFVAIVDWDDAPLRDGDGTAIGEVTR